MRRLLLLTACVLVSACGVVRISRPIATGQKVLINSCTLVTQSEAQEVLAAPTLRGELEYEYGDSPTVGSWFYECRYAIQEAPFSGEGVEVKALSHTVEDIEGDPRLGTLRYAAGGAPFEAIARIGIQAFHGSRAEGHVHLRALTKEGVGIRIDIGRKNRSQDELLSAASSLMLKAVERAEAKFPEQDEVPPSNEPTISPCRLASVEEIEESFGGPLDATARAEIVEADVWSASLGGPFGESWVCLVWSEVPNGYGYREFQITLAASPAPIDNMINWGEPVSRVGAAAFWTPPSEFWPNGNLTILGSGGREVGILTYFAPPGSFDLTDATHREAATKLARSILARL